MFNAIGAMATRRPWLVIGAWVLAAVALSSIGGAKLYDVTTDDTSSFLPRSYESVRAIKFGESRFGQIKGATTVTGLVQRNDHQALTSSDERAVKTLVSRFPSWHLDVKALGKSGKGIFGSGLSNREKNVHA